jgi:hypothetical protein
MTAELVSDRDLGELIRTYDFPFESRPPFAAEVVSCLRELQERRIEVEKYKAWAASCDPAPVETQAPQAPIALLTINMASEPAGVTLYAPGLPPGDHQLYCEPEKVAPYMRAPETSGELLLTRNALGNLYMAVLKFGPIDRDIQFAMNEAGQLLGSPIQVKEASGGKHG